MEQLSKLLKIGFNVTIFFLGLTFLYTMFNKYNKLINNTYEHVLDNNTVYQVYIDKEDNYINYGELMAVLMDDIQYDIEIIEGNITYEILSNDYKPEYIGEYQLSDINYKKSYLYDENGDIRKVIFEGVIDGCT